MTGIWSEGNQRTLAFEPPQVDEQTQRFRSYHASLVLDFLGKHSPDILVVTGAGISTESMLPDYRSPKGAYSLGHKPITYQQYTQSLALRQRYWVRSWRGFSRFLRSSPNSAHYALTALEQNDMIFAITTQNVDRLHQRAGSQQVLELHGNLYDVVCLSCRSMMKRKEFQDEMAAVNPTLAALPEDTDETVRPDGDVNVAGYDPSTLQIPGCPKCGGLMKPNVVFFGESIPSRVVEKSFELVEKAKGVICLGTSLQVFSSFRLIRHAASKNIPVCLINIGETRADNLMSIKIADRCGELLPLVLSLHKESMRY